MPEEPGIGDFGSRLLQPERQAAEVGADDETGLPANVERFCYWWGRGY